MQMHLVFIIFCILLENLPQGAAIDKHWNRFKVTYLNQKEPFLTSFCSFSPWLFDFQKHFVIKN
jgi:hypothetical protein